MVKLGLGRSCLFYPLKLQSPATLTELVEMFACRYLLSSESRRFKRGRKSRRFGGTPLATGQALLEEIC